MTVALSSIYEKGLIGKFELDAGDILKEERKRCVIQEESTATRKIWNMCFPKNSSR